MGAPGDPPTPAKGNPLVSAVISLPGEAWQGGRVGPGELCPPVGRLFLPPPAQARVHHGGQHAGPQAGREPALLAGSSSLQVVSA